MFLRFCLVGTLGFFVDAGILLFVTRAGFASAMAGRVLSFIVAACVTWYLNRRYTFQSSAASRNSLPWYIVLTGAGALLNLGVYRLWIAVFGKEAAMLLLGVAAGSIVALFFNFVISKRVIFKA